MSKTRTSHARTCTHTNAHKHTHKHTNKNTQTHTHALAHTHAHTWNSPGLQADGVSDKQHHPFNFHFSILIFISNIKAEGLWGGPDPPTSCPSTPTSPLNFVSFFHANFYSILGTIWEPFGSWNGSQNRPRTPQKHAPKLTSKNLRFPTPFWDDFSSIFDRLSRPYWNSCAPLFKAFLQTRAIKTQR